MPVLSVPLVRASVTSRSIVIALSLVVLALGGCGKLAESGNPGKPPLPKVTVGNPLKKDIINWDVYTGRFAAVESVEVRARVSGYLESIHFQDGAIVKKGDLLFVIDPRPFKAELERAEGDKEQAEAKFRLTKVRLERNRKLLQEKAISQETYDERLSEAEQAEGQLNAAKGAVRAARLNVEFTEVRAPINGRVSRHYVSVGNLVSGGSADSTLLTTIESLDPIYLYFDVDERTYLKYVRLAQEGERPSTRNHRTLVLAKLANEEQFTHRGYTDFVDNRIDAATATIRFRAVFPNPELSLLPGVFAQVKVPGSGKQEELLIPASAVVRDQDIQFVYVLNANNVVERRRIVLGPRACGLRVVRSGVGVGDRLIVKGIQSVRAGGEVQPAEEQVSLASDECLAGDYPEAFRPGSGTDAKIARGSRR